MIQFVLMVNKQGQTRLAKYFNSFSVRERVTLEGELIRKCLSRTELQCSFLEHRQYKVIYRRYASLYFIIGVDNDDEVVSTLRDSLFPSFRRQLSLYFPIKSFYLTITFLWSLNRTNLACLSSSTT